MEVSVEHSEGLERRIRVQIPSTEVEKAVEDKVRRVGQHAKIPGFRPGKVPLKVLYQRYGERARAEVASEIVQSAYPRALDEAQLKPAGQPKVDLEEIEAGKGLSFTAAFEVYPEIALLGLEQLKVTRPVAEITDADVDKTLASLREQNKEYLAVARASQEADQVVIDYEGKIDGETFSGGSGEDIEVVLGSGRFLPDLEAAIVGRSADESFEAPVQFPDDYGAEDLAGKSADFSITIKAVAEPKLPEIDAAFCKKFAVEGGGEAALREKIRDSLQREAEQASDGRVKTQVMDALHQANPIAVPEAMVSKEIEAMRREAISRMPQEMQQDQEQLRTLMPDDALRAGARRRAALGLLLAEVIAVKQIKLDQDRVEARLDEMTQGHEQAEQVKVYYRSQPQMLQGLQAMVMEGQVVDQLLADAAVEEQKMSLDDLMKEADA